MATTNYFSGIVKVLEIPKRRLSRKQTTLLTIRAELPQNHTTRVVSLVFWGNLGRKIEDSYKVNDYILVEGYISLRNKQKFKRSRQKSKQVNLTILKVYPILLDLNKNISSKSL